MIRFATLLFASFLLLHGCTAQPEADSQMSGVTNWLRCEDDPDCSQVAGGYCDEENYCRDETGQRVSADDVAADGVADDSDPEPAASTAPGPESGDDDTVGDDTVGDDTIDDMQDDDDAGVSDDDLSDDDDTSDPVPSSAPDCGCESVYAPACGVNGTTYDAACGLECVPVEVACTGECPCTTGSGGSGGGPGASGGAPAGGASGAGSEPGNECVDSIDCGNGFDCCDGRCVLLANDPYNCGECNRECSGAESFCAGGSCIAQPCDEGTTCTDGSCCGSQCCGDGQMCCQFISNFVTIECFAPVNGTCPLGCPDCDCASPNTPIATPEGERPIAELTEGDLVYSIEDNAIVAVPIQRVRVNPVLEHEVVRVALANGQVLEVSANHPTADGRNFAQLHEGGELSDVGILDARLIRYEHEFTYDILPASSTGVYFAAGVAIGSTLHSPSVRALPEVQP